MFYVRSTTDFTCLNTRYPYCSCLYSAVVLLCCQQKLQCMQLFLIVYLFIFFIFFISISVHPWHNLKQQQNKQHLMQHLLTAKEFSTIFHCSCFSQTASAAFDWGSQCQCVCHKHWHIKNPKSFQWFFQQYFRCNSQPSTQFTTGTFVLKNKENVYKQAKKSERKNPWQCLDFNRHNII